jgi:hypothetical protein
VIFSLSNLLSRDDLALLRTAGSKAAGPVTTEV